VVSVSLIDFILQIVLLMAFLTEAAPTYADAWTVGPRVPDLIVFMICANYFIRKSCELIASITVLRRFVFDIAKLIDILSVALALMAYMYVM
jgi:hypothetical protein